MGMGRVCQTEQGLRVYLNELFQIFKTSPSKHKAHERSRRVLEDIAADRSFIRNVLRHYLSTPAVLNQKNYPVVGMTIALNPQYHLVAHCWIPLPNRQTNISCKAIHHHGNMLLTTLNIFGPGYEHWVFTPATVVDPERELYAMDLVERQRHTLHNIGFVDAWIPHVPVYPESLTITLCLWSNQHPTTWRDYLKRIPFLKGNEEVLKRVAAQCRLAGYLDLKMISYFDFYPTEDGFKGMRNRIEYALGPNEDHLHSVFHVIQETGNDALAPLVEDPLAAGFPFSNRGLIKKLLHDLRTGRRIDEQLSQCHLRDIPHATYTTQQIEQAIGVLRRGIV